jgi:hypothetical protein
MAYSKPQVTIDLEEYNELLKAKENKAKELELIDNDQLSDAITMLLDQYARPSRTVNLEAIMQRTGVNITVTRAGAEKREFPVRYIFRIYKKS